MYENNPELSMELVMFQQLRRATLVFSKSRNDNQKEQLPKKTILQPSPMGRATSFHGGVTNRQRVSGLQQLHCRQRIDSGAVDHRSQVDAFLRAMRNRQQTGSVRVRGDPF
jgi:hypothetical protein